MKCDACFDAFDGFYTSSMHAVVQNRKFSSASACVKEKGKFYDVLIVDIKCKEEFANGQCCIEQ